MNKDLEMAQKDVSIALGIWTELLNDQEYAYAKGSAIKKWETIIDYVPILSDLDIHVMPSEVSNIFEFDLNAAGNLTLKYEKIFIERNSDYFHLPRIQLFNLKINKLNKEFIPPLRKQIKAIVGKPRIKTPPNRDFVRKCDRKNMQILKETTEKLPMSVLDRNQFEMWTLLRRLNWKVSPTPIRLLTQIIDDDPMEIWGWNRTTIVRVLRKNKLDQIANHYENYYKIGWKLFDLKFNDTETYLQIIKEANGVFTTVSNYLEDHNLQELGI